MNKLSVVWMCFWILCSHVHTKNLSESCQRDYNKYQEAEAAGELWSLLLKDANGKPEAGVSTGNLIFEGDYNTCQGAVEDRSDPDSVRGLYCMAFWQGYNESFLDTKGFGFCIPHRCTDEDALQLTDDYNPHEQIVTKNKTTLYCSRSKSLLHDGGAIVSIIILVGFGLLTIVATIYDICCTCQQKQQEKGRTEVRVDTIEDVPMVDVRAAEAENGSVEHTEDGITTAAVEGEETGNIAGAADVGNHPPQTTERRTCKETLRRLLLCFSLYTNIPRLVSTKPPPRNYSSLHGIRFLAMSWILLGHTYSIGVHLIDTPVVENRYGLLADQYNTWHYEFINQMFLSVETFFILSGLLVTMSFLRTLDKQRVTAKQMACHYFHRYWRLTPVYAIVLMFYVNLLPHLADGPFYNPKRPETYDCSRDWWKKLLYVDNIFPFYPNCMPWTWYITCDFQFYIMAPLFIYFAHKCWKKKKSPKLGGGVILAGFTGSLLFNFVLSFLAEYKVIEGDWFFMVYYRPWTRATTYFLGMTLGYALYVTKAKVTLGRIKLTVGWAIAVLFMILAVYTEHFLKCRSLDPSVCQRRLGVAFFNSIRSTLFALGVLWIVFVCMTGNGGLVHRILSWKVWLPLSRLTYVVYLVHEIFQLFFAFILPVQLYYYNWLMINLFVAHLVFSLATAFGLTLVFEIPFGGMEKVLRKKDQ